MRELKLTGVRTPNYNRRADLVCFVNGLPLVFIELKAVYKNIRTGFDGNLRDYMDENVIGHAFHHNAFLIVSNGDRARYASFTQGVHETGRNRIELVLQTRDPEIDSDLGWEDTAVLRSEVVGGAPPGLDILLGARTTSAMERTVETRAGATVSLDSVVHRGPLTGVFAPFPFPSDLPFWEATATIAASGDRPRRLMLREFERFYTDHIVPEHVGSTTYSRRIVEERLVYADIVEL